MPVEKNLCLLRLFRLERVVPTSAGYLEGRELGIYLWSHEGVELFEKLFGSDWRSNPRTDEFALLARIAVESEDTEAVFSADELDELLGEIGVAQSRLEYNERASAGLRLLSFAIEEAVRSRASLAVRSWQMDFGDMMLGADYPNGVPWDWTPSAVGGGPARELERRSDVVVLPARWYPLDFAEAGEGERAIVEGAHGERVVVPTMSRAFRLTWGRVEARPQSPRQLGVFLWSNEADELFQVLFGDNWRVTSASAGRPLLARMAAEGEKSTVRYASGDLRQLLSEVISTETGLSENAMFALRTVRFATEEARRAGADLEVYN